MTQTARRAALLPLCLVSVTVLGACGAPAGGEATSTTTDTTTTTTSESPAASPSGSAAGMTTATATGGTTLGPPATSTPTATGTPIAPTVTAGTSGTPTVTVTVTATGGTAAPLPSGAGTPAAPTVSGTPSGSASLATVPASRLGSCHHEKVTAYTMNLTGLNEKARQTAQTVYRASRVCIPDNLIRVATRDNTRLAYGKVAPKQAFALPQTDRRYDTALKLMGLQSVTANVKGTNTYIWPRVIASPKDESAWQEVTDLGLITKEQAATMRKNGGYSGPQLWIDETGAWRTYTL